MTLNKVDRKSNDRLSTPFGKPGNSSKLPAVKAKLLEGKKGLVVGIANDQSIAWGCAKAFRAFGAGKQTDTDS